MRIAVIGTVSSSMVGFRGPLLKRLVGLGHEVYAFAIDYDEAAAERVRDLGAVPVSYALNRTGVNPIADLKSTYELSRKLKSFSIDFVFTYFVKPVVFGSFAARMAGVGTCYGMLPGLGYSFEKGKESTTKQKLVSAVVQGLLRRASSLNEKIVVYNLEDELELVERNIVSKGKIERVNGTGIDTTEYSFSPCPTQPVTFALAARLIAAKGVRDYVSAARALKEANVDCRFILLGGCDDTPDGIPESEVRSWVDEGLVEWPGKVKDVRPWLEQTSVYVLPSCYREGVPRSSQEAMAMGRAIITTDNPGCRETVEDGKTGFLVPPHDVDTLADKMRYFIEHPEKIASMGLASRKLAEKKFDVHRINAELIEILSLESTALSGQESEVFKS
ncbi:hypothetical protein CAI21_06395 [Alkalilimnicola ehrlichii]|uniref:Glycosyltransferase family 1 protein n=1 Tax=Alkalilimnicola ehrlichii TaxID=351052 RepID=A0A3E0X0L3_9GAMM|nr:glycosyltransferase family 4 protein [Alkalilimnicola ehrlichii]RFA30245.1 hypothetical protein CAI21_06395 [Alkalilimnicola ehrlichii]RFA37826.1 hypothetical protein CAL65_07745 [Alkalilimnicola ehrlichii]